MHHPTMPPPVAPPPGHGRPAAPFVPTQFRAGRVLGLLALVAVVLAVGFLAILYTHGKQRAHQAIEMVETDEVPDHHVVEELQRGYKLKDRLLRPAMVRVAKNSK